MSGATNCPETPRQKMIGMMYLVLTAMLALNVSAQILEGYTTIYESMTKSVEIADETNENLNAAFSKAMNENEAKARPLKVYVDSLKTKADDVYNYIEAFKKVLTLKAKGGDSTAVMNVGDLNSASELYEGKFPETKDKNGKNWTEEMKVRLEDYREFAKRMVVAIPNTIPDSAKAKSFDQTFSYEPKENPETKEKRAWNTRTFEDQPAIAVLATMAKLQNDVRNAEAECMSHLIGQLEAGDFSVNKIQALAIPDEPYILRGSKYRAKIVLAATDSTKKPEIEINGKPLEKDVYEFVCGNVGKQKYSGKIKLKKKNGMEVEYPFTSEYTVGEPTATVSADMMNVLYAGFDNPVSVSVPGVDASSVSITVTNASQSKTGKGWIIKPQKVGTPCKISVSANIGGRPTHMAMHEFRVKPLPPPLAKLRVKQGGAWTTFKGGAKIDKAALLTCEEVVAELDDADLNVKYNVLSFALNSTDSMGNTLVEMAQGNKLTQKQKDIFKKLTRGKTVYVANTVAVGPDKMKRTLPVLDVAIK